MQDTVVRQAAIDREIWLLGQKFRHVRKQFDTTCKELRSHDLADLKRQIEDALTICVNQAELKDWTIVHHNICLARQALSTMLGLSNGELTATIPQKPISEYLVAEIELLDNLAKSARQLANPAP